MKLKKKYRIDGEDWKTELLHSDGKILGQTRFIERTLGIDMASNRREVCLLHEAIHVISDNADLGLEESKVTRLACGVYAFIRDNKINFLEEMEK